MSVANPTLKKFLKKTEQTPTNKHTTPTNHQQTQHRPTINKHNTSNT